ncbi:hypothetical protein AB9F26_20170 [Falsihalocynthiibacter sp. BN13B15]|uniref:hypothetical protein n=1 Tax=Falsihalocynthiibacter sp. BN13B15 TaxID=3240871 RepID=UPI00350FC004
MGHSYSPVDAVMGRLFDDKHKKKSGGQERPRRGHSSAQRLARTAQAQRPSAVFKLIRSGGTTSRAGLKGQLEYVFDKADDVLDAQGRYEGQGGLSNADMNRVTRLWEGDMWGTAKTGYTSHLLLSYPIGTAVGDVSAITKAVCEEMFQSGDVHYDYVAGIHTDRITRTRT